MSYPNALRRYIATLVDLTVAWTLVFSVVKLASITDLNEITFVLVIVAVAAYEPLSTVYGCTLGQALMRFRVRTVEGLKRISLTQAYGRFALKYLLGVISFVTMPARSDRRAIHDLASETIVVEAVSNVG